MDIVVGRKYTHVKTGKTYLVREIVKDEGSSDELVIYGDPHKTRAQWARPAYEFKDGRFVPTEPDAVTIIRELKSKGYVGTLWNHADIRHKGEELGYQLSQRVVNDVAAYLEENFDANIGINWDVIEEAIEHCYEESESK